MKLRNNLLAAALLAVAAPAAMAQSSSGDITIGGTLMPGSCTITIANGGLYDYGQINTSSLNASGPTAIGVRDQVANIACTGPTTLALTAFDNRDSTVLASSATTTTFGLGLTEGASGNPVGHYVLSIKDATVNGIPLTGVIGGVDLVTWANAGTAIWQKSNVVTNIKYRAFGTTTSGPLAVTTASFTLSVGALINDTGVLALRQLATMDGSATIELTYI